MRTRDKPPSTSLIRDFLVGLPTCLLPLPEQVKEYSKPQTHAHVPIRNRDGGPNACTHHTNMPRQRANNRNNPAHTTLAPVPNTALLHYPLDRGRHETRRVTEGRVGVPPIALRLKRARSCHKPLSGGLCAPFPPKLPKEDEAVPADTSPEHQQQHKRRKYHGAQNSRKGRHTRLDDQGRAKYAIIATNDTIVAAVSPTRSTVCFALGVLSPDKPLAET